MGYLVIGDGDLVLLVSALVTGRHTITGTGLFWLSCHYPTVLDLKIYGLFNKSSKRKIFINNKEFSHQ